MKKLLSYLIIFLLCLCTACESTNPVHPDDSTTQSVTTIPSSTIVLETGQAAIGDAYHTTKEQIIVINNDVPYFTDEDKQRALREVWEEYSELDALGRCGVAYANLCKELRPTEPRGEIGMIKPSGWHTVKYDIVDGNYLYNRCHLIAFMLAGENANERNLITGTRSFNADANYGMLKIENLTDAYLDTNPDNHVLYRVTPVFDGDNLVASYVLMEAWSVEDNGVLSICAQVNNIQPGILIDYKTGDSKLIGTNDISESVSYGDESTYEDFVLNTNSKKFHKPDCESVSKMSDKNKELWHGPRQWLIDNSYTACGTCNP